MKKSYLFWTLLVLFVSVNTSKAQTYSLKDITSEQFALGGTNQWSFERHDVNTGTYEVFQQYGDSGRVNYYDAYMTERFNLYPIMDTPASGDIYTTKRNSWFSSKNEFVYVASEYPNGTNVSNLVYGEGSTYSYPDSLQGYEVYSIHTGVNAAITFTVPQDGYYRADMKVMREDLWNSIGQMKVYQFFRYNTGDNKGYAMGKEFAYGTSQQIDCHNNSDAYATNLALLPENPVVAARNGGKAFRGLPSGVTSSFFYFYAKEGDKISFEADARSTGNTETSTLGQYRGAYARTKWLNLAVSVTDQATAEADASKYTNPYETDTELLDSLYTVLDLAEEVITREGPANGYYKAYLDQLEALYTTIDNKIALGAMSAMEIPAAINELWAAIDLARTPILVLPTSGEYYVIKNYTTGTYLGGKAEGTNAVVHEDAATNPYYHIFLFTGDNDNGYTFQQVASGNYVTHNNQWTGSYETATGNNRQLFNFDNMSSPDYYVIKKKKDDGTFANGIGFDNATAGSVCYLDKGTDKWNTWLFDATEAKTILVEQLDVAISEAQQLYDNNSEIDGAASVLSAITTANTTKNDVSATSADYIDAINPLKAALINIQVADNLRLAIADAQSYYTQNSSVDGAADFQTAISAAQATYNASKSTFDSAALTQAVTDLATAKKTFGLKVAEATGSVENPVEITSYIVNPGFDENNSTGWTTDQTGSASNYEYELYNKASFDFHQIITGLPVGQYKITVQGFHRVGVNSLEAVNAYKAGTEVIPVALYANDNASALVSVYSDPIDAGGYTYINGTDTLHFVNSMGDGRAAFDDGKYTGNVVYTFVSDGTLRLGIKTTGSTQNSNWTLFDNFQLFYCGKEVSVAPYIAELQAAYDTAKEYYDAILASDVAAESEGDVIGKYSYATYTALSEALTAAKTILDTNPGALTAAQINAAKTALIAAKSACVKGTGLNSLASGDYYMLVNDTYYVTNPGNFETAVSKDYVISVALGSLSEVLNKSDDSQVIKITKEANGRYLFFSGLYEEGIINSGPNVNYRNINENAAFRAEYGGEGELTWRTVNILSDGTNYAIQNAENSAAKGYWGYDATNQKMTNGFTEAQYVFKFISVSTGLSTPSADLASVYGVEKRIRVVAKEKVNVSVYSITGTLIASEVISDTQDIPVQNAGIYIVKINNSAVKVLVR